MIGDWRFGYGRTVERGFILMGAFIAVSMVVIIALQSATLHLNRTDNNDGNDSGSASIHLSDEDFLRQTFPGRFHIDSEIEDIALSHINLTLGTLNTTIPQKFNPQCTEDYCLVSLAVEIHACCCKINTRFFSPRTAIDTMGRSRTLSQFRGNRQYFYDESCTQINSGPGCICVASPIYNSAVYNVDVASRKYGVSFFQITNLCKPLNT